MTQSLLTRKTMSRSEKPKRLQSLNLSCRVKICFVSAMQYRLGIALPRETFLKAILSFSFHNQSEHRLASRQASRLHTPICPTKYRLCAICPRVCTHHRRSIFLRLSE